MDERKAEELFKQVKGIKIEEITIEELIDQGKSAAVFRGKKDDELFAIKIFDNDIVRKDEFELQQKRIDFELSLKDHRIPNLVKILGGGEKEINKTKYYYLIMEYVKGMNLKKYIETEKIDIGFIVKVIRTLVDVTEELFKNKEPIVHRDIKPENIMVTKKGDILLMDMGVIKIVGTPSMTDISKKEFLGTLRYAPPEFLEREEKDNEDGWRAVNIYQIGAVLHDLIMKKELFSGVEPYPKLVIAIKYDMPSIINDEYHPDLIQLARDMLQKDWKNRLATSNIDRIKTVLEKCLLPKEVKENLYNNIKTNALTIQAELDELSNITRSIEEKERIRKEIHKKIWEIIDNCFTNLGNNDFIDKIEKTNVFILADRLAIKGYGRTYKIYIVNGKFKYGFSRPVLIVFNVANNEQYNCKIMMSGLLPDGFYKLNINEPENMLFSIFGFNKPIPPIPIQNERPQTINLQLTYIFDGIIELNDNTLKDLVDKRVALIIERAIDRMRPDIQKELEIQKKHLTTGQISFVSIHTSRGPIIIDATENSN
jgi:serine/threonine protein kinase